jgi:hypothetical protein
LTAIVFQPKLDILGMVIYATEFVLWCGVFACGGYFNLLPWVRQRISDRAEKRKEGSQARPKNGAIEAVPGGVSNDIDLGRIPSSTSVFRTPSSVISVTEDLGLQRRAGR